MACQEFVLTYLLESQKRLGAEKEELNTKRKIYFLEEAYQLVLKVPDCPEKSTAV
jgi:hypothetical protein